MSKRIILAFAAALVVASTAGSAHGGSGATISGRVSDGGVSVAGATVLVQAWPDEATAEASSTTQPYSVATGSTGADGSYSLTANLARLPAAYVEPDGTINLDVQALHDGKVWTRDLPAATSTSTLSVDLATGSSSPALLSAETSSLGTAAAAADVATASSIKTDVQAVAGCGGYWGDPYGPYQTKLGDVTADQIANGTLSYSYGGSTNSTLGVEYFDNSNWSVSGTDTVSATTSHAIGWSSERRQTNRFFAKWYYHTWFGCLGLRWRKPDYYGGRGDTVSIAHPTYSYCGGPYYAGAKWHTGSSKNQTYTSGLYIAPLDLSSQSGWVSSMTSTYYFSGKGWICGSTNAMEGAPKIEADGSYQTP